jgi:hypothetical protein
MLPTTFSKLAKQTLSLGHIRRMSDEAGAQLQQFGARVTYHPLIRGVRVQVPAIGCMQRNAYRGKFE